jgi:pyruvate-ferredoxin/flavodoxin oxidoreductase
MGSGAETALETIAYLQKKGERSACWRCTLYRPGRPNTAAALPKSLKALAVLDPHQGAGFPKRADVTRIIVTAFAENSTTLPKIVAAATDFPPRNTPPRMVKAVLDELKKDRPKNHFTVGIHDDVSQTIAWTSIPRS